MMTGLLLLVAVLQVVFATTVVAPWPSPEAGVPRSQYWQTAGNTRFAITVTGAAQAPRADDVVTAFIPWRRTDEDIMTKDRYIVAPSGKVVAVCAMANVTRDAATVVFKPEEGAGTYYLYYMPFYTCEYQGGVCPFGQGAHQIWYNAPTHCGEEKVLLRRLSVAHRVARVLRESKSAFDDADPMEVSMTAAEREAFVSATTGALLVTEDRARPVRMTTMLPAAWVAKTTAEKKGHYSAMVRPGENFTYQIAVVANPEAVRVEGVTFAPSAVVRDARCMNLEGSDFWGRAVTYPAVEVAAGGVGVLWMAMEVDAGAPAGTHTIGVRVALRSGTDAYPDVRQVTLTLTVAGAPIASGGDDDITRGTRLQWLDSQEGLDLSRVPPPYTPIRVESQTATEVALALMGKDVVVGANGLPQRITTHTSSPTGTVATPVLARPVELDLAGVALTSTWALTLTTQTAAQVAWVARASLTGQAAIAVTGSVDSTGYFAYNISVAGVAGEWRTVLRVPVSTVLPFAVPFGVKGGYIRDLVTMDTPLGWQWDGKNGNNAVWVGGTRGGLRTAIKGDDPLWQAGVPFDSITAPAPPASWYNGGKGGAQLFQNGTFEAFTGTRTAEAETHFVFTLVVTPVRPLDLPKQFASRWAQIGYPLSNEANYTFLAEKGATVVNMHQGTGVNPWINYPYLTNDAMDDAASTCHRLGMKFSIYNTMRELSNRCQEIWAMLAFNETFVPGERGGTDWLQEHLRPSYSYSAAWSTPLEGFRMDSAIRTRALSRWNNYYVAGLRQMKRDFAFDGMYLDEIAYDRVTLMRSRTVLGEEGVVDHHSDQGQFMMSPALGYMELYPFIDRLWYGEGFDYDHATPEYWLVEMSGIAFGLTADLLRYAGSTPYHIHGLLYGSSNRWQSGLTPDTQDDPYTPIGMWQLWKEFNIAESTMYGWWMEVEDGVGTTPITASSADVKVTSYVRRGAGVLLAVANFADETRAAVTLVVNFEMLGIDAGTARLSVPAIMPFQADGGARLPTDHAFDIPARGGHVLLLQ